MFTRQHHEFIAQAIREVVSEVNKPIPTKDPKQLKLETAQRTSMMDGIRMVTMKLGVNLKEDNSNFNGVTFWEEAITKGQ